MTLIGGTHVTTSPCFHFLDATWRVYLERFGLNVRLRMMPAGLLPARRGRGSMPSSSRARSCAGCTSLHRGPITRASGFSAVAGLPDRIAKRQARRAEVGLRDRGVEADLPQQEWAGGPGTRAGDRASTTAPVPTLFFGLGARGKPAEKVADEARRRGAGVTSTRGAPVDPHSADQVVLPLALAEGP